jgi:hypothetical protein
MSIIHPLHLRTAVNSVAKKDSREISRPYLREFSVYIILLMEPAPRHTDSFSNPNRLDLLYPLVQNSDRHRQEEIVGPFTFYFLTECKPNFECSIVAFGNRNTSAILMLDARLRQFSAPGAKSVIKAAWPGRVRYI